MKRIERCIECDEPTGKAGRLDDSLYLDAGDGPYCESCFRRAKLLAALERVAASIRPLLEPTWDASDARWAEVRAALTDLDRTKEDYRNA